MVLWPLFAIMTLAASLAVLWPLIWTFASQVGGNEAAVYKDQLTELDRDVAAGLIGVPEVEAARVEIGRRLLAALDGGSDPLSQTDSSRRRVSVVLATVLLAAGIYVIGFSFPVVPKGEARIRVQLSAIHERAHLDRAIESFISVGKELGVV